MICKQFGCVFVHIPKAAGQSVETFFLQRLGLSWEQRERLLLCKNSNPSRGPVRLAHLTAQEYVQHHYVSEADFNGMYKFSFVRNPWDRLVSEYRFGGYAQRMPFKTFVFEGMPQPSWSDAWRHVQPQSDFLYDAQGQCLVNYVGRFESLHQDFNTICEQLRITDATLPHVNSGGHAKKGLKARLRALFRPTPARVHSQPKRPYTAYYDDETRDRVAQMYQTDIRRLGYSFAG